MRVATTLWLVTAELVLAVGERIGPPVDSYLNGSQVWLTEDGPGGARLEWRLHPVGGYRPPAECSHHDLWGRVVSQLAAGGDPEALRLGEETRSLGSLWGGLECYPPDGHDPEPQLLAAAAAERLGRPPDRVGMVDHAMVEDRWQRSHGATGIAELVGEQLER